MKRHTLILRGAAIWLGAMLCVPLAGNAQTQQQVKVGGNTVCSGDVTMQVDPAGNLNFPNCVAGSGGGGGAPTAPVCSNTTVTVNADPAATPNITASCNNGGSAITGYTWAPGPTAGTPFPGTAPTGASFATGPFPTAGTSFTYTVTATNAIGTSNTATVTVSVVAVGACGTAVSTQTWTSLTYNTSIPTTGTVINALGFASFKLPIFPTGGKSEIFQAIQASNPGNVPLPAEFVISACPGDFTNVVGACKVYGVVDNGNMKLTARTVATPSTLGCALTTGTQYYLNVRNVNSGTDSNACTNQSGQCSMIVQHHGG